ncbi:hypothetical protein [Carnimonas nigrificans]|uniref:hypothetical protein n=1 Tax=Carnimonas nigrificans TaxID=64323 RepID=UPI0004718DA6|nr:hypothetical protein [Carnimonas nigrificans]
MDLISWIVTGALVGGIFNILVPQQISVGFLGAMGAGALGGVVVSFICSIFGVLPELAFSGLGVGTAVVGSVIAQLVVLAYRKAAHV